MQFVQDTSIERYLEAGQAGCGITRSSVPARSSSYRTPARPASSCPRCSRINELYAAKGFRVVSGEGGRPFGLDRYGKAFFVAWYYKHRVALGDPSATIRTLAAKEGITGRFAEHVWIVVNKPHTGYPDPQMTVDWLEAAARADRRPQGVDRRQRAPGVTTSTRRSRLGPAGSSRAAIWPPAARATRARSSSTTRRSRPNRLTIYTYAPGRSARRPRAWTRCPGSGEGVSHVRRRQSGDRHERRW